MRTFFRRQHEVNPILSSSLVFSAIFAFLFSLPREVICAARPAHSAVWSSVSWPEFSQNDPKAIHELIQKTYNFQPHLLNDQERDQKSTVLDGFWSEAKANRDTYIPVLREELADLANPRFFLYDGSMLLLSLSDTPADRKIALRAIANCDLADIQPHDYFLQVHRMASLNEDTTAAAFHILEEPHFQVYIPEHSLTLGQNYCLVYMLLPIDATYWVQPAIQRLKTEKNETAQQSLLLVLWYAQTESADRAIAAFATSVSEPLPSRQYAQKLLRSKDEIGTKESASAAHESEAGLRQKRRERMKAVSDEALIDLDQYTIMLIAKRKPNP